MNSSTVRFNRDALPPEIANVEFWPTVDTEALSATNRKTYEKRERAIMLYMSGIRHKDIARMTGVTRSQTSVLVRKCLAVHADGKIYGFRALLPFSRVKAYVRITPLKRGRKKAGFAGALEKLFRMYPDIKDVVVDAFLQRVRDHEIHESRIPVKSIHKKFIDACRAEGIGYTSYPFNAGYQGLRGLAYYLKKLFNQHYAEATKARSGSDADNALNSVGHGPSKAEATRPYQCVEFDGHKIDLLMVVEIPTIYGDVNLELIERIWLLTVIERFSRAILGYFVSMGAEYNQYDVLRAFKNAITPWVPKASFTITGLHYKKNAGFPSGALPEYAWARWSEIAYDNANANLAQTTRKMLTDVICCQVNAGRVKTPERRGIQERFYQTLEENGFHRLPSTTGSGPDDPRRKDPETAAKQNKIKLDQVLELVEVLIANYNATPHAGIGYKTPLEMLSFYAQQDYAIINRLDESEKPKINKLDLRIVVTVLGNVEEGRRPYVQWKDVRYRNDVLSASPHLIGQKLSCYVDINDPRTMTAYLPDGAELGVLVANGRWGVTPHTLTMRLAITKLKKRKVIDYTENDDPIMIYMEHLQRQAPRKKRAAKAFAEAHRAGVPPAKAGTKAVPVARSKGNVTTPAAPSTELLDRLSQMKAVNK